MVLSFFFGFAYFIEFFHNRTVWFAEFIPDPFQIFRPVAVVYKLDDIRHPLRDRDARREIERKRRKIAI